MTTSQTKHINCHSDFTLTERFITIDDEGNSAPAGVPECDFRLIYRTRSWHTVAVGRIAGELTPDCRINDDGSLLVTLSGEALGCGPLTRTLEIDLPNPLFSDGTQRISVSQSTGIELWPGTSDAIGMEPSAVVANYLKGDKGEKGDTGAIGPQGVQGETGPAGPQGPRGEKGDTGATGPQGAQGEKGERGDPFTYDDFTPAQLAELSAPIAEAAETINARAAEIGRLPRIFRCVAGRWWDESLESPAAAGYYGDLDMLRNLPSVLGLGCYLVRDDRSRRKLSPTDHYRFTDGGTAALDGTMGQYMWCWNAHYYTCWQDEGRTYEVVSLLPLPGKQSLYVPAGGTSALGAGVMDNQLQMLASVVSSDERYRGGEGFVPEGLAARGVIETDPQATLLGMPCSEIPIDTLSTCARKRGRGWEANWYAVQGIKTYLLRILLGTRDIQQPFSAEKDALGLCQGGFGSGVTDFQQWSEYNGCMPLVPTATGIELGDGCGLVHMTLYGKKSKETSDTSAGPHLWTEFDVPVFFGLKMAGFGHLANPVTGVCCDYTDKTDPRLLIAPSLYAGWTPNSFEGMLDVGRAATATGLIDAIEMRHLTGLPLATLSATGYSTRFCDQFRMGGSSRAYKMATFGGTALEGSKAGIHSSTLGTVAQTMSYASAPLCYLEEDLVFTE